MIEVNLSAFVHVAWPLSGERGGSSSPRNLAEQRSSIKNMGNAPSGKQDVGK